MFSRVILFFLLLPVPIGHVLAGNLARSKAELETLQQRIIAVQQRISTDHKEADVVTATLDEIEQNLARLHSSMREQNRKKISVELEIKELKQSESKLRVNNNDALERLAGLLRSNYIMGRRSGLRLLINQQDPQDSIRQLTMFQYIVTARNVQIQDLLVLQEQLRVNQEKARSKQNDLDLILAGLDSDRKQFEQEQATRITQLSRINQKIAEGNKQIVLYREREQSLKTLLRELSRPKPAASVNSQSASSSSTQSQLPKEQGNSTRQQPLDSEQAEQVTLELSGFGNSRGSLPLPVKAPVRIRYGQKKPESGLTWEGVLFNSQHGQPVTAVYSGQVVFSDWFRGYGQLMVVDHGEGYMSLYGYNQLLQVGVGEAVQIGQVIAMASEANKDLAPGLYFEIRHNGTPDDPLQWCR